MTALKRLLFGAVLLICALLAAVAVNQTPVQLQFLVWQTPAWSVFWWLLAAFVLGAVLGYILAFLTSFKTRMERRKLQRSVDEQASELQRLRALAPE